MLQGPESEDLVSRLSNRNMKITDLYSPDEIQFGFWYVGEDEHHLDQPQQYQEYNHGQSNHNQEQLHQRPGRSSPSLNRDRDFLHLRLLETLNKMALDRSRLKKSYDY